MSKINFGIGGLATEAIGKVGFFSYEVAYPKLELIWDGIVLPTRTVSRSALKGARVARRLLIPGVRAIAAFDVESGMRQQGIKILCIGLGDNGGRVYRTSRWGACRAGGPPCRRARCGHARDAAPAPERRFILLKQRPHHLPHIARLCGQERLSARLLAL
jgi:hypothetical protein